MLLSTEDVNARLSSPDNLINKLKSVGHGRSSGALVNMPARNDAKPAVILGLPPRVDELMGDIDEKLVAGLARNKAAELLTKTLQRIEHHIDEDTIPANKLPHLATVMNVIANVTEQGNGSRNQQVIIFRPMIVQENHYDTIQVSE